MSTAARAILSCFATTLLGLLLGAAFGFLLSVVVFGFGFSLTPPNDGRAAVSELLGMSSHRSNQILANMVGFVGGAIFGVFCGAILGVSLVAKSRRKIERTAGEVRKP